MIGYEIKSGLDGKRYAVFANCDDAYEASRILFCRYRSACFGAYDNAFEL